MYIFPVRLEACKAPERIGNFNWTDLFGDDHEDEWKALLPALNAQAQRLSIDVIPAAPPLKSSPSSNRRVVVTGNMQHSAIFSGDHKTLILARTRTPPSSPKSASLPANFTESIKGVPLEMIFVPAGKFMMGSTEMHNEMPPHKVSIPSFHIGKYQVTQAQWKAVMGDKLKPYFKGDNLPMENISWNNTKKFCENLSKLTGKDYRLPSEAEWEYACRAGTTSDYAGKLDQMAWYMKDSKGKTRPVGQKSPNAFGVYDMHGNVWEWCEDVWHNNYDRAPKDGSAWSQRRDVYDEWRVLRGGSWFYSGAFCRSAFRSDNYSSHRDNMIGFRVVVSARTP